MGDGREERGAVSTVAHGGEDPCGMVPISEVGDDIFSAEGEELEEPTGEEQLPGRASGEAVKN